MRYGMVRVWPLMREHMLLAQQAQAQVYNRGARLRKFTPGELVLALISTPDCKFLTKWQGPYEILE